MSEQETMKAPAWDLESIFPGGSKSEEYADFRKKIAKDLEKAKKVLEKLPGNLKGDGAKKWAAWILEMQRIYESIHLSGALAGCLVCQDVNDSLAQKIDVEVDEMASKWGMMWTSLESFAKKRSTGDWKKFLARKDMKPIGFPLNETREHARLKMPEDLEKLALELGVNGYHGWNKLYDKMAGDYRVEIEEDGEKKTISLGQNSARLSSPDRAVRKDAFAKMEKGWDQMANLASMALDFQAGFRLALYKNRNWDSPLFEALLNARMKQETLDSMWSAVVKGRDKLKDYINAKKKLMGIEKFCWYDQAAPVGKSDRKIPYDEAADFIVKHLSGFSKEMSDFSRKAIDKKWIEAEDRSGKAAGGWCSRIPIRKESRIFMTYTGTFNDLGTLAHELGHAYHGFVLKDEPAFAQSYPMTLAETASIFNELRVTDAALEESNDRDEKLMLVDQNLQNVFTFYCNIYARYLFDRKFYEERKSGMVGKEKLNEIMLDAQKEAFFGILDEKEGYHPLFWASKLHFFLTGQPFYNFPYTFGYLFASGVYDRAVREGPAFARDYRALLADTGKMKTEDVAQKHLGVDLTKEDFWADAVKRSLLDVDKFVELAAK
ncbi:MAG: M3 family oligoendopeptidase [Candidatus Zixiibacteriota bacterium]|nr:MAG: M3 family oligoendopeptidase [candidate division Zixibacteria bacterium]